MTTEKQSASASLMPCPFCGSAPNVSFDEKCEEWWIVCGYGSCDVEPKVANSQYDRALASWNRRANPSHERATEDVAMHNPQTGIGSATGANATLHSTPANVAPSDWACPAGGNCLSPGRCGESCAKQSSTAARGAVIPFDLLDEIEDYFEQRQDVRDGSDGPRPNREMHLYQRLRDEAYSAKPSATATLNTECDGHKGNGVCPVHGHYGNR